MSNVRHGIVHGLYARTTEPAAPRGALLFVHGLGESGLCFEHLLDRPELAPWRLLVPDLVGYGRTPRDGRARSLAEHAEDLAAWLTRVGVERAVVLGHSMGGVIAVLMAERHPDRVTMVVDVDGNSSLGDCVYSGKAAAMPLEAFTGGGHTQLMDAIYRAGVDDPAQRGYYASQRLCDPAVFHRNSLDLLDESRPETLPARRAALPMPLVYIAGAPRGASARSRQLLDEAGVDVKEIAPSGHWPFIDQPDAFCAALGAALEGSGA